MVMMMMMMMFVNMVVVVLDEQNIFPRPRSFRDSIRNITSRMFLFNPFSNLTHSTIEILFTLPVAMMIMCQWDFFKVFGEIRFLWIQQNVCRRRVVTFRRFNPPTRLLVLNVNTDVFTRCVAIIFTNFVSSIIIMQRSFNIRCTVTDRRVGNAIHCISTWTAVTNTTFCAN